MLVTRRHDEFEVEDLISAKRGRISVCLLAREVAGTVGPTVREIGTLVDAGLVDEVVVVDADSRDGTADEACRAGADVVAESSLRPELGPVRGKGDAMWRVLPVLGGDVIAFCDADSDDFTAHFITGILGPVLTGEGIRFAKATFERPFRLGAAVEPGGGGRVTELCARPLLALLFEELAAFRQPLAGEVAADRRLLESIPFATGYAVEAAMLIDVWRSVGLGAMAEVDLGTRQNSHQPLPALRGMAREVAAGILARAEGAELAAAVDAAQLCLVERPPLGGRRPEPA